MGSLNLKSWENIKQTCDRGTTWQQIWSMHSPFPESLICYPFYHTIYPSFFRHMVGGIDLAYGWIWWYLSNHNRREVVGNRSHLFGCGYGCDSDGYYFHGICVLGALPFEEHEKIILKEIVLKEQNPWNGMHIRDLDISRHTVIVLIKRRNKALIPKGNMILREGDRIFLYTQQHLRM